ncbi:MAG TPA: arylesterase [Vicinamibacteria bacterium]|jgi:acyl-CoA thioesterase-1
MFPRVVPCALALLLALGCEGVEEEKTPTVEAPPLDRSALPKIVAFGDSLTAGFGIGLDQAYPAVLQELLDDRGYAYEVVNAGVSGDTSAGGVRRLDWVLDSGNVEVLILALGANDGLRGLPASEMKKNLADILSRASSRGVRVLLAGFEAPPDSKDRYVKEFVSVFPELAREHEVALMPSLLEGIAGVPDLNQEDGKHPNVKGARVLAGNVLRALEPLLSSPRSSSAP